MFEQTALNLIQRQAGQYVALNEDGTTRLMNPSPCAHLVGIDLFGLRAYAAFNPLQLCPGLEVRTAYMDLASSDKGGGCQPSAIGHDLPVAGLDLRREVFFQHPSAARYAVAPGTQHQEAVLTPKGENWDKAEPKNMVPWGRKCADANQLAAKAITSPQDLLSSLTKVEKKSDGALAPIEPRALLNNLIVVKNIDLTAQTSMGSRAAYTDNVEHAEVIPAGRGTPSAFDLCPMAAVPFQVIRQ